MKVKLKTLKQIRKENPDYVMEHNGTHWNKFSAYIHYKMYHYFGHTVEVEEETNEKYILNDLGHRWTILKDWVDFDFISEEEFMI